MKTGKWTPTGQRAFRCPSMPRLLALTEGNRRRRTNLYTLKQCVSQEEIPSRSLLLLAAVWVPGGLAEPFLISNHNLFIYISYALTTHGSFLQRGALGWRLQFSMMWDSPSTHILLTQSLDWRHRPLQVSRREEPNESFVSPSIDEHFSTLKGDSVFSSFFLSTITWLFNIPAYGTSWFLSTFSWKIIPVIAQGLASPTVDTWVCPCLIYLFCVWFYVFSPSNVFFSFSVPSLRSAVGAQTQREVCASRLITEKDVTCRTLCY